MISQLLEVKSSVIFLCNKLGWNSESLSNSQWKQIEITERLLEPFAQYTTLTSGEEKTISLVIPILLELEMHLQEEVCSITTINVHNKTNNYTVEPVITATCIERPPF